ncbi:MAG: nucleoside triphosphate pyrophosphohydrolase [Clostridia bacterium]|nr:nucleoside triphosphate pyrophosphohydrolase [Clostridia bacterium]MBQ7289205.1 nucleoside triphosphate pyrophosphohydrolase [Clostridia bacterium]
MENFVLKDNYTFADLISILKILRAPGGCPWDREQTHQSIRNSFIEETYEAVDAIDNGDTAGLCEELGDVLLQVIFHAQLAEESGAFDINAVCDGICKKLIYRHPHVFSDTKADTSAQVLDNWDKLKRKEKHQDSFTDTLYSVPKAFPALIRSQKVQKRAAKAGFDWPDINGSLSKLSEESKELREAISNHTNTEEELGDLMFSIVNIARFLNIDAEQALTKATDKFISRFAAVEDLVTKSGKTMSELSLAELDSIWDSVKSTQ